MQHTKRYTYWIAVIAVVFLTFWFGYLRKPASKPQQKNPVPVEVKAVAAGSIEETIEFTAWVRANQTVYIRSKVAGRVESLQTIPSQTLAASAGRSHASELIDVEEGVPVRKDQQIAVIDREVYLAHVAAAKANVDASRVELEDAQREKNRILALYQQGSATEQSSDKAVTAADLAKARLNSAVAALELAQINLNESTIVSPIDGIVTAKYVDQGNLISAGDKIVTVADLSTVKLIVAVPEKYAAKVAVDTPVRIELDAFPDTVFDAKVYSVHPALDEQTHTIQVEIRLHNDEILLKPGMFARVTLITERKENVVVVPRDVVLGGKVDPQYVYVVEAGLARKRFVQVGITQADMYEINDGLKVAETLVVNGMNFLTDGTPVEVVRLEDIK